MSRFILTLLILAFFLPCASASAALKSSSKPAETNPKDAYNPKEDPSDFELPMPDGMKMVLRAVKVPAKGLLDDKLFYMGISNPSEERSLYERSMPAHVSAPFRQADLPKAWKDKLEKDEANDFVYYFLGKYELTNGQWDAVMGEQSGERGELPKTNISWYDLQEFLRKYNEWLLANHPDSVPSIDGTPGFLRLPNEVEWEFAAKGGDLPPAEQDGHDFIGGEVEDFAVFGSRYDNPRPIGTKKPNNLGIYDLAGNASELVQDGFRFTIADQDGGGGHTRRLHGAEGGLLSKGGNFLSTDKADMYPGRRVEARMFVKNKDGSYTPLRDRGLGARLVLASLNVPGTKRADLVRKLEADLARAKPEGEEKKKAGATAQTAKGEAVVIDPQGDPVAELEKIYVVTQSPDMRKNLDQFRMLIKDVNEAFTRERDANLLNTLRSVAYMADSLSNIAFRCFQTDSTINIAKMEKGYTKENDKRLKEILANHFKNLEVSTNMYRVNVRDLAKFPKKEIESKLLQLTKQYSGQDRLNVNFRKNLAALGKHVNLVANKGMSALEDIMIWQEVVPNAPTIKLLKDLKKNKGKPQAALSKKEHKG